MYDRMRRLYKIDYRSRVSSMAIHQRHRDLLRWHHDCCCPSYFGQQPTSRRKPQVHTRQRLEIA
jgi:hypothetical protein